MPLSSHWTRSKRDCKVRKALPKRVALEAFTRALAQPYWVRHLLVKWNLFYNRVLNVHIYWTFWLQPRFSFWLMKIRRNSSRKCSPTRGILLFTWQEQLQAKLYVKLLLFQLNPTQLFDEFQIYHIISGFSAFHKVIVVSLVFSCWELPTSLLINFMLLRPFVFLCWPSRIRKTK